MTVQNTQPSAGWYPHSTQPGWEMYWDGIQWHQSMVRTVSSTGPMTSGALRVDRKVNYVRQQKGHSAVIQFGVVGILTLWIVPIYYLVSPNHYYHI